MCLVVVVVQLVSQVDQLLAELGENLGSDHTGIDCWGSAELGILHANISDPLCER